MHALKVRLAEIDTPESKQPYGNRAQQSLAAMTFGKYVRLKVQDHDRYGRTVARIYQGNVDVNANQVRLGSAWVYRQHLHDRSLLALEDEARAARRGLWALPEAQRTPPWEWRKAARKGTPVSTSEPAVQSIATNSAAPAKTVALSENGSPTGTFSCSKIKSCRQMTTCAEARYQLTSCHNGRIDGDGDGVPCEALCK